MPPLPSILIRHIHLPSITPFHLVQTLQTHLVSQFLNYKASLSTPSPIAPPAPTILTFVPTPVYTTGRREHDSLSPEQLAVLKAPLSPLRRSSHNKYKNPEWAAVVPTLRGGQTTFHGPGQLVVYPILDLKPLLLASASASASAIQDNGEENGGDEIRDLNVPVYSQWPKGISVRCYVNLLEQSTINTLAHWTLKGKRTENPGVWDESGERKIAALGVHLRRNITSYGVGLNVNTDLRWFDRIVACGLVGKGVISMRELGKECGAWEWGRYNEGKIEGIPRAIEDAILAAEKEKGGEGRRPWLESLQKKNGVQLRARLKPGIVARTWVREFARGLVGEGGEECVVKVGIEDLDVPEKLLAVYKLETEPWRHDWEDDW
ncbi:hypothetical protein DL95DRAFT_399579 [Leptodontidium sp. 2 PMI_412]|nr:hypothetical protein DL95DRAFT_399579 [Leptodontidium sp. 2 PMI_412]